MYFHCVAKDCVVAPSIVSDAFASIVTAFPLESIFLIMYSRPDIVDTAGRFIVTAALVASTKITFCVALSVDVDVIVDIALPNDPLTNTVEVGVAVPKPLKETVGTERNP